MSSEHQVEIKPLAAPGGGGTEYEVSCSCGGFKPFNATSEKFAKAVKTRHLQIMGVLRA